MAYNNFITPLLVRANKFNDWLLRKITIKCFAKRRVLTRSFRLKISKNTEALLSFDKVSIRLLVGLLIRHCIIRGISVQEMISVGAV